MGPTMRGITTTTTLVLAVFIAVGCGKNAKDGESKTPPTPVAADAATAVAVVPDAAPAWEPPQVKPEWWTSAEPCPKGAVIKGAPPPKGFEVKCEEPNGVVEGPATFWSMDGNKRAEGPNRAGVQHGVWIWFRPNGKKRQETTFKDGVQHGQHRMFYEDGRRRTDGWYVDGLPHGTFSGYDQGGVMIASFQIDRGNGTWILWHGDRSKAAEYVVRNGEKHGLAKRWFRNGRLESEINYKDGKQHGKAVNYWDNGKKKFEGKYVDRNREGKWTYWDKNAEILRVEQYVKSDVRAVFLYQGGNQLHVPLPPQGKCATDAGLKEVLAASGRYDGDCLSRSQHFPGLVFAGSFAHDRGCIGTATLLDCKLGSASAKTLLTRAGWKAANAKHKETLAVAYIKEVDRVWRGGISSTPDNKKFALSKDGSVTLTAWITRPSGMVKGTTMDKIVYRFSADGDVTRKTIETRKFP